jgi:hypothetical protein
VSSDQGVVLDEATGSWRTTPPAPIAPRATHETWIGDALFVWGGRTAAYPPGTGQDRADGATYDPATGAWRLLPPPRW